MANQWWSRYAAKDKYLDRLDNQARLLDHRVWQGTRFMAWMYILKCADGSYYVGSTKNLELRLSQHQEGVGAKYTSKRLPVELVYSEEYDRVLDAYNREKQVQNWSKAKREALINGTTDLLPALAKKKFTKNPLVE